MSALIRAEELVGFQLRQSSRLNIPSPVRSCHVECVCTLGKITCAGIVASNENLQSEQCRGPFDPMGCRHQP